MSDLLYRVMLNREPELVDEIHHQLMHSNALHYKNMGDKLLLHRVESLVAHFIVSLRENQDHFINYVSEIASERIHEGFRLAETLMSMRILEERLWLITVEDMPMDGRVQALARVTNTIGAAKDQLAEVYVENAERKRVRPEDSQPDADVVPTTPRSRIKPSPDGYVGN